MRDNLTFFQMQKTGISVETPGIFSESYRHFQDFMEGKGWVFNRQSSGDELSDTYTVKNINPDNVHKEWDRDLGEYQSRNLRNLLRQLYACKGFIDSAGDAIPMCDHCEFSSQCYQGYEDSKPNQTHPEWSFVSVPWIGQEYQKYRIAILGINPNEDGGLNELDILVAAAKKELLDGHTKVNFGYVYDSGDKQGQRYAGTFLWHRIAAYTKAITHNHPEGVKGAQATTAAIFLCRFYAGGHAFDYCEPWSIIELKAEIKKLLESNLGYDLSRSLDEIHPTYRFNESCQDTVPQAITAFLESTDFEDAIRNAISLGGDSDTLAAITGSIAEAAYGIPQWIKDKAWSYLDEPIRDICRRWRKFIAKSK